MPARKPENTAARTAETPGSFARNEPTGPPGPVYLAVIGPLTGHLVGKGMPFDAEHNQAYVDRCEELAHTVAMRLQKRWNPKEEE